MRGFREKDTQALDEARLEASEVEDLRYIKETIYLLTGGYEICQHSTGPYCNKHRRPIKPGDPRCEFFARRLPEDPDKARRAQERHILNERFGISEDRSVRRLTGAD
jgi:hypothetical protein